MKTLPSLMILAAIIAVGLVAALWMLAIYSRTQRPDWTHTTIPSTDDSSPNSVSSRSTVPSRQIEPIAFEGDSKLAWETITAVIDEMPRANVVRSTESYLHAEFATRIMAFVDDLELELNPENSVIEVRSQSRVGYADRGVNRRRVEEVRERFEGRRKKTIH